MFWRVKKKIIDTDERKIDDILSRSIAQIFPSKEAFKKELMSGRRLKIYIGTDPTGPELHIGHATNFLLLEKLRQLGHEIVILFGDFTARIGDPTGKETARKTLTAEEVRKNIKTWTSQVGKVLSLKDKKNPARIVKNSAWLSKLSLEDVIGIASQVTVQHMIERDMFEKRLEEGKPIHLHEFLYPLLQGYDSVALDVDAEVGGNDQTFNMLVGRTLQKKYHDKEKFVIATALLENPKTGKKLMNKSEGGFIGLSDTPRDMYGKTMALPDEVIISVCTDATLMPLSEIEGMKKRLASGGNPRDEKMRLARELVALYHDKGAAKNAEAEFVALFQKKETPENVREITASRGASLRNLLLEHGLVSSGSEFGRLVKEGAVKNIDTGEKIRDITFVVDKDTVFKLGKRSFVKVVVRM
mgnify:FL=1